MTFAELTFKDLTSITEWNFFKREITNNRCKLERVKKTFFFNKV